MKKKYVSYDVTFFENQPYFTQNSLQGKSLDEAHSWDVELVQLVISYSSIQFPSPIQSKESPNYSQPMPSTMTRPKREHLAPKSLELHVYTRRQQHRQKKNLPVDTSIAQNLKLNPHQVETQSGTVPAALYSSSLFEELPTALRKGVRSYSQDRFVSYRSLSPICKSFLPSLEEVTIPETVPEVMEHSVLEMAALGRNRMWEITTLPNGVKQVGCKLVFTSKHKVDGTIDQYKARLVVKGYTQTYGINFL